MFDLIENVKTAEQAPADYITTVSGSLLKIKDACAGYPMQALTLHGKSTQNGTPTLKNNVAIEHVHEPIMKFTGENLVNIPSFSAWWTFADANLLAQINSLPAGKYFFSFLRTLVANTYSGKNMADTDFGGILIRRSDGKIFGKQDGAKWNTTTVGSKQEIAFTFEVTEETRGKFTYARWYGVGNNKLGTTGEALITDVQITPGQIQIPYSAPSIQKIEAEETWYRGIPVASGGNYTDENGQQWLCDELIYKADGTCQCVRNTKLLTLNGSSDENWNKDSFFYLVLPTSASASIHEVLCTFSPYKYSASGGGAFISKTRFTIGNANPAATTYATVDAWREFLKTNPQQILYALATPVVEELPAYRFNEFAKIQLEQPTSIVTADGANLTIGFVESEHEPLFFQLNGKSSAAAGITMQGPLTIGELEPVIDFEHVAGKNGDAFTTNGEFKNRDISGKCYYYGPRVTESNAANIDDFFFKNRGYVNLYSSQDRDHYWKAVITHGPAINSRADYINPFEFKASAMPQMFRLDGLERVEVLHETVGSEGQKFTIFNPGNAPARPVLKICRGGNTTTICTIRDGLGWSITLENVPSVVYYDFNTGIFTDKDNNFLKLGSTTAYDIEPGEQDFYLISNLGANSYIVEVIGRWIDF